MCAVNHVYECSLQLSVVDVDDVLGQVDIETRSRAQWPGQQQQQQH